MTNARSIGKTRASKQAEGDIANWLDCICQRDDEESGAFRKTLDSLLAG